MKLRRVPCRQTIGSVLLHIGLFTRPAAFIMSGEMAIAYWYAHFPRNPFPCNNGGTGTGLWSVEFEVHRHATVFYAKSCEFRLNLFR